MTDTQVFAAFIASDLTVERARRDSQQKLAAGVITTSSGFIALTVAGLALLLGKDYQVVDPGPKAMVTLALLLFVASAVVALVVIQLVPYLVATAGTMRAALSEHWNDDPEQLQLARAWIDFDTLTSLRAECNKKSMWLVGSLWGQVVGALVLGLAATWLVFSK